MQKRFLVILALTYFQIISAQENNFELPTLSVEMNSEVKSFLSDYQKHAKRFNTIPGYRVQIYNGSKQECMDYKKNFLRQNPSCMAYLTYESPEYRIQVGNFRTRLEAEAFLREIIGSFPGSFVVKSGVVFQ